MGGNGVEIRGTVKDVRSDEWQSKTLFGLRLRIWMDGFLFFSLRIVLFFA